MTIFVRSKVCGAVTGITEYDSQLELWEYLEQFGEIVVCDFPYKRWFLTCRMGKV